THHHGRPSTRPSFLARVRPRDLTLHAYLRARSVESWLAVVAVEARHVNVIRRVDCDPTSPRPSDDPLGSLDDRDGSVATSGTHSKTVRARSRRIGSQTDPHPRFVPAAERRVD